MDDGAYLIKTTNAATPNNKTTANILRNGSPYRSKNLALSSFKLRLDIVCIRISGNKYSQALPLNETGNVNC